MYTVSFSEMLLKLGFYVSVFIYYLVVRRDMQDFLYKLLILYWVSLITACLRH